MKSIHITSRKKKALVLLSILVLDVLSPLTALALTGGPSQPEVQSFEPVGTSEMVNIFSGDFNYNIPLLDVNGYPINIAYHAGVSADQEASWVGLGWNINPGTINRSINGLPDDMNGETITKELNLKDNWTMALTGSLGLELFGKSTGSGNGKGAKKSTDTSAVGNVTFNLGIKYNSYKGLGMNWGAGLSHEVSKDAGLNAGLALGYSDEGGLDISPSISLPQLAEDKDNGADIGFQVGGTFNSRAGMRSMNVSRTYTQTSAPSSSKDGARAARSAAMLNAGLMYSFGSSTYTPGISTPFSGFGIDFNYKTGTSLFGIAGNWGLGGSFSNQYISESNKTISKVGYGYLYEQEAPQPDLASERDYILDFQRQNEMPLMEVTPYLPWAQHTNDMYGVSAQGVGGTYRLFRNEVGVLHDDYRESKNKSYRLGVELGLYPNLAKGGINYGFNHNGSESGLWDEGNALYSRIGPVNNTFDQAHYTSEGNKSRHYYSSVIDYEPAFFREVNELVPQDENYLSLIDGENNLHPKVFPNITVDNEYPRTAKVMNTLYNHQNRPIDLADQKSNNTAQTRTVRNKLFTYLTASDKDFCLDKSIRSVNLNAIYNGNSLPDSIINRNDGYYRKGSHISEVTIYNNDGSRHVFGIPAYNKTQVEKSFRVELPSSADEANGLVKYNSGDNSLDNKNGIDGYYSSTTTPAYAHSYLITGVLSPDYVDLTGNGITEDDLGSAVKFNYTRTQSKYKWRTPYKKNRAKYAKGLHSDVTDGTGSVVYGEKEIWHVHSIEGKTHIALFKLSKREDGLGVIDQDGGRDTSQRQYKLDSIQLFSKRDLQVNGSSAVPIKTVHFEYDYSLCPGVANQVDTTDGKLTLKKIYFTYGKSRKGKLNAYKFSYDNTNASYHLLTYDMWGTYTPYKTEPSNAESPYTSQNSALADQYAAMWNLNKIELPSGGVINVTYEADDYAYVQDKRAMSMLQIKEFGYWDDVKNKFIRREALYGEGGEKEQYDYVFFDLKEDLTGSNATEVMRKEYLKDIEDIQITVYSMITRQGDDNYEYIKSYAKPAHVKENGVWEIDCGVTDNGATGWVRLEKQHIKDKNKGKKINPVALSAFQYTRMNLNYLIQKGSDRKKSNKNGNVSLPLIGTFIGMLGDIANMAVGPNRMLMERKFCRTFDPQRSWIRLNSPDKQKIGGGHRVKEITMSDMWADINSADGNALSAQYGQQYDYTKSEESESGYYTTISSGVATYEPMTGRDENPFVKPHYFDQKRPGVPDARYTFEHPIGENFMPGASVGYSSVKVSSIDHSGQNPNHRTGYQISEFFTARDFPVQIKKTPLPGNSKFLKPRFSFSFIYGEQFELATAGQGYTIVLNDMHGKPRANYSYDEYGKRLSGAIYEYQTDDYGNLDNQALTIQPDGTIEEKTLGVNVDLSVDFQHKSDQFYSADGDFNLDAFAAGFFPVFIPTLFPNVKFNETNVYTAVSTKVVRKIGLLKKTTALKEGSEIHTENLLYDGKTGQVLLTSVGNEFGQDVYNFNYPAHWAYDQGMGQAFQNWGLEFRGISMHDGKLKSTEELALSNYLVPGDEGILTIPGRQLNRRVYVVESRATSTQSAGDLCLIDGNGNLILYDSNATYDDATTLRIIRSGRRNMASVSIGSVTTLSNPLVLTGGVYDLSFSDVLATSAVEFKDDWRTELPFISGESCDTVVTDFYWALHNSLKQIVDSSLWQHAIENYIETDTGTAFPNSTGKFVTNNQEMHWSNFDSCWRRTLVDYLDKQGADPSDLTDSVFAFRDLLVRYIDSTPGPHSESSFLIQDTTTYTTDSLSSIVNHIVRGYDPYIWLTTETTGSGSLTMPIFWKDLQHSILYGSCRVGDIDGYCNANFGPSFGTIYDIDTNSSLANLSDILSERNTFSGTSSNMQVNGTSDYFAISFEGSDCEVQVDADLSNITELVSILDYNVVNEEYARITAKVKRLDDTYDFDTTVVDTAVFDILSCFPLKQCQEFCYTMEASEKINPYRVGVLGNWRPHKSWTYVVDRDYDGTAPKPDGDGTFTSYTPFWQDAGDQYTPNTTDNKWVWTSEVTEYSPYGMELENVDPLGRYSSAQYGFAQTLPTAVGSNMRHRQLWYEGFEEYQYLDDIKDQFLCPQWYYVYDSTLDLMVEHNGVIDDEFSHSGNISLGLNASDSFIQELTLDPDFDTSAITSLNGKEYFTRQKDQVVPFRPTSGKYVLSAWVHQDGSHTDTLYDDTYIKLEFEDDLGGIQSYELKPSGIIINGWQRIEASFDVPADPHIMRIKYMTGSNKGWFDDLRIHPYNGNMKSYAYDYRTLRLMAELDENNYATFYQYDLEGNLVRVKKETVKGIRTLQENRQHQIKSN
ncbi:MAG: hypothetical protein JJ975_12115 [Bacteroidia bacterium]|nr:hypothetical protein [Bacteroidia bacterium]